MKIQCPCGAKYAFEITPEMASRPITFVCSQCGVDSSALVNQIIRESLGGASTSPNVPVGVPVTPSPAPQATPRPAIRVSVPQSHAAPAAAAPPVTPAPSAGGLRVAGVTAHASSAPAPAAKPAPAPAPAGLRVAGNAPATPATPQAAAGSDGPTPCHKHHGQFAHERCVVCQKPICPKCMEMFGYVCSAFCKGKAEEKRIYVPAYAGQKAVAEARYWRKSGLIFGAIVFAILAVVGAASYYKWFLSVPSVAFSVKMAEKAYSGSCRIIGENQVVFLHGGLLARHDMKAKKEVWSRQLIDRDQIGRDAEKALEKIKEDRKKALDEGIIINSPPPLLDELKEDMLRSAEAALSLYVADGYLWLGTPEKLVKYDWQTGQPGKEVALEQRFYDRERRGDELGLVAFDDEGEKITTKINLQTGDTQTEGKPKTELASAGTNAPGTRTQAKATAARSAAGNPKVVSGQTTGSGRKPLDPAAIAASAQNLPLPSRIALPAVIATSRNQQQLSDAMDEMDDIPRRGPAKAPLPGSDSFLVADGSGTIELSVTLLEKKIITKQAMKAPPKKSVLDGDIRVTQSSELVNEMLNDAQRDLTGGLQTENASRYSVRLKRDKAEWTGEVTGYPSLFPLKSCDVIAAPKQLIVLDKQAKKMWESPLSHGVKTTLWKNPDDKPSPYGAGPFIERENTLYVIDEGVVSAFDATTGNARWRLPSVGVLGMHFDDAGMIYINTTTASPEKLRYSQQIDVTDQTRNQVLKVEASTGKTVWAAVNEGLVNYLSGKFIYAIASYEGDETEGNPLAGIPGATTPAHVRITRLNPKNGKVMWEHYQRRAPIDIQIDKNTIQILFRKEMQVLKYFTL